MINLVNSLNSIIWSVYVLVPILICCALYFGISTKFVQFRLLKHTIQNLKNANNTTNDENNISSIQAFAVGLASRIGTGNLAGVATALVAGGPGAIFWMWVISLLGSVNAFVESTLAQLYKVTDDETGFRGGPAYYMSRALNRNFQAKTFAFLLLSVFACSIVGLQANTISNSLANVISPLTGINFTVILYLSGFIFAALSAYIVFGGAKRVVEYSTVIVSTMATIYLLMALFVVLTNISELDNVLKLIFTNAFSAKSLAGGTVGGIISTGFKRGLFSNEAGMGTAPNAAASADTKHPITQGLIQALGALIDTIIICTSTAFIILISGVPLEGTNGIGITQNALQITMGNISLLLLTISIIFFAFSTILGIYFYGQSNFEFVVPSKKGLGLYKAIIVFFVLFGSIINSQFIWTLGDLSTGLLALVNLIAIVPLFKHVKILLTDYEEQLNSGIEEPVFDASQYEEFKHLEIWTKKD